MELINLLEQAIPSFGQTFDVSLNWIGQLIRLLVSGVGIVGVGVILFSLILRCVVLPFDVYQRIAMRKQNQKMKEHQMTKQEKKWYVFMHMDMNVYLQKCMKLLTLL